MRLSLAAALLLSSTILAGAQDAQDAQKAFPAKLLGHALLPASTMVEAPTDAPADIKFSGKFIAPGKRVYAVGTFLGTSGGRPTGLSTPFRGQPVQGCGVCRTTRPALNASGRQHRDIAPVLPLRDREGRGMLGAPQHCFERRGVVLPGRRIGAREVDAVAQVIEERLRHLGVRRRAKADRVRRAGVERDAVVRVRRRQVEHVAGRQHGLVRWREAAQDLDGQPLAQ